ncbi:hypothetical protein B194_4614 [Serratia plymuthica A30]|nr:hypothetical protein B194_4614 [Serratia plymuthica A30]
MPVRLLAGMASALRIEAGNSENADPMAAACSNCLREKWGMRR